MRTNLRICLALVTALGCQSIYFASFVHAGNAIQGIGDAAEVPSSELATTVGSGSLRKARQENERDIAVMIERAESGDAEAQVELAEAYRKGIEVPLNFEKATELYQAAAKQDDLNGIAALGEMHEYGLGTPIDYAKAFELYEQTADQDYARGKVGLARLYLTGKGVSEPDVKIALGLLKSSAESNLYPAAFFALGKFYMGEKLAYPRNYKEARRWLDMADEKGSADAQNVLGDFYTVNLDTVMAEKHYTKAAEQGHPAAMFALGTLDKKYVEFRQRALNWYEDAAEQNSSEAQLVLGVHKWNESLEVFGNTKPKDRETNEEIRKQALSLVTKAANQGLAEAQYFLAWVVPEKGDQIAWLRKASEQHHADAQVALAQLLLADKEDGDSVADAKELLSSAAKLGHQEAAARLAILNGDFKALDDERILPSVGSSEGAPPKDKDDDKKKDKD